MKKNNVPKAVELFRFKKKESEQRMAQPFVAYVRVSRRPNAVGYIVYSSDSSLGSFVHDNFASYWVAPDQRESKRISNLIDSVRQQVREWYLDENFVAAMVVNVVSEYAKLMLDDIETPQAMSFGMITIDDDGSLVASLGTGTVGGGDVIGDRAILMAGCTDPVRRKAVQDAIVARLIKGKGTLGLQKKLSKEIQRITGLKIAGCAAVPRMS